MLLIKTIRSCIAMAVAGTLLLLSMTGDASAAAHGSAVIKYSLANGASTTPFKPVGNRPVLVMGVQTALGFRGVGQVTLLRVPSNFLEWTGIESPSGAAITSGFSSSPGTHIVYLDFDHTVDVEVNDADSFIIHNASGVQATGSVTVIW
jgi:hypothetical protein